MRIEIYIPEVNALVASEFTKRFVFSDGNLSVEAICKIEDGTDVIYFTLIDGQSFDSATNPSSLLFAAESYFREQQFKQINVLLKSGESVQFPPFEFLRRRPELTNRLKLECEVDRYDGPISGFISDTEHLYWFDWCMEAIESSTDLHQGPRVFSARQIPQSEKSVFSNWIAAELKLENEFQLAVNPDIYPLRAIQKKNLRSIDLIEADASEHHRLMPSVYRFPISNWFTEPGEDFAAVKIRYISEVNRRERVAWETELAQALEMDNDYEIKQVIARSPVPLETSDIFWVRHQSQNCQVIDRLCDYRGIRLSDDFIMSAAHRVQDLTTLVKCVVR